MKKSREQLDLGLAGGGKRTPNRPERGLEVHCANCGAKFVAYYGYDEENEESIEVRSCGLCHGEEHRRGNFKNATIRLVAEVTARR
jgi:hypothetical protein